MNRKLLLGCNTLNTPINFPENSLIAYAESISGKITILKSWTFTDEVTNAKNLISCIQFLRDLTNLPVTTNLHMFFNTTSVDLATSTYTDISTNYPLYIHGINSATAPTAITITERSTVERLFKTVSNMPIEFSNLSIHYAPTEYQSDTGVIELDRGGPVHFKDMTLQGMFNAGIISHLDNQPGKADASTITNVTIFAWVGYGSRGSFIIDRGTKFGKIENLEVSNRNRAITINQLDYPFNVSAIIDDGGMVEVGGLNATYDLTWNGSDSNSQLIINANNSFFTYKGMQGETVQLTVINRGNCNTINGIMGPCVLYKSVTVNVIETTTSAPIPNVSVICMDDASGSIIESGNTNASGSITFTKLVLGRTYMLRISSYTQSFTVAGIENETWIAKINSGIKYTLTYYSNGGTEYLASKHTIGTSIKTLPVPSKIGYTFVGWFDESLTQKYVVPLIMNKNYNLYAAWNSSEEPDNPDIPDPGPDNPDDPEDIEIVSMNDEGYLEVNFKSTQTIEYLTVTIANIDTEPNELVGKMVFESGVPLKIRLPVGNYRLSTSDNDSFRNFSVILNVVNDSAVPSTLVCTILEGDGIGIMNPNVPGIINKISITIPETITVSLPVTFVYAPLKNYQVNVVRLHKWVSDDGYLSSTFRTGTITGIAFPTSDTQQVTAIFSQTDLAAIRVLESGTTYKAVIYFQDLGDNSYSEIIRWDNSHSGGVN